MIRKDLSKICDNISNIENYDKAINDKDNLWVCHHRLETHSIDGYIRKTSLSYKELINLGLYFSRPAEELIFLTRSEHRKLHQQFNDYKDTMSKAKRGQVPWNKGVKIGKHSEEHKQRIAESLTGNKNHMFGKHWKLVDGKRVYY